MSRLKLHAVIDTSHDGYEVTTACGLDGWRNDGTSQWYTKRGSDKLFRAAFEHSHATCEKCKRSLRCSK